MRPSHLATPAAGEGGATAAVFCGLVSTDNRGGFTSVRSKNYAPALDCGAYEGLELRVMGDGQRYKCIIRSDSNWDGIAYCRCADAGLGLAGCPAAFRAVRMLACCCHHQHPACRLPASVFTCLCWAAQDAEAAWITAKAVAAASQSSSQTR